MMMRERGNSDTDEARLKAETGKKGGTAIFFNYRKS
jgi:hypothetical protein